LAEIRWLKDFYPGTSHIYLQSETIALNLHWLEELCHGLAAFNRSLADPIAYTCNFRVARAFLEPRVFAALQQANVSTVEIGLESGSERLRCSVLRRHYSNADFFRAVDLARQHGMRVNIYNLVGIPGETPRDYWETVQVNHQIAPDRAITSIFHPYPGTDLFETCKREGWLPNIQSGTSERWRATLELPGFSRRQVQRAFEWFDYRVYRGHRPWHFRFRRVLRCKAFAHPWAHALFMRLLPIWHSIQGRN
jgi:coproporphyrinogen III oxidase-like Fe-S oxidoreductase